MAFRGFCIWTLHIYRDYISPLRRYERESVTEFRHYQGSPLSSCLKFTFHNFKAVNMLTFLKKCNKCVKFKNGVVLNGVVLSLGSASCTRCAKNVVLTGKTATANSENMLINLISIILCLFLLLFPSEVFITYWIKIYKKYKFFYQML